MQPQSDEYYRPRGRYEAFVQLQWQDVESTGKAGGSKNWLGHPLNDVFDKGVPSLSAINHGHSSYVHGLNEQNRILNSGIYFELVRKYISRLPNLHSVAVCAGDGTWPGHWFSFDTFVSMPRPSFLTRHTPMTCPSRPQYVMDLTLMGTKISSCWC
jgi:hypothetical protein